MFEGEYDRAEFLSTFCTTLACLYQNKIARRGDATIGIMGFSVMNDRQVLESCRTIVDCIRYKGVRWPSIVLTADRLSTDRWWWRQRRKVDQTHAAQPVAADFVCLAVDQRRGRQRPRLFRLDDGRFNVDGQWGGTHLDGI